MWGSRRVQKNIANGITYVERGRVSDIFICKRMLFLLLIPMSLLLKVYTQTHAEITEQVFSRGIYKYYAIVWGFVTGKVPFSIMEIVIAASPFLLIATLTIFILNVIREEEHRIKILITSFINMLVGISIIFFWLTLFCNVNFDRLTFSQISGLTVREYSKHELYELCQYLAQEANNLRSELVLEDETGAMMLESESMKQLSDAARTGFKNLSSTYKVFDYTAPTAKPVIFSSYMSYTDLVGVYCPFTVETNINMDVAHYSIPSIVCHEMAHFYGYMREDEANYISYLACVNSDSVEFKYSGTVMALIHAGNQLYLEDPMLYQELIQNYEEGLQIDFIQNSNYWKKYSGNKISEVATVFNDTYLKMNNQSDGVKSYGRMVDLLLAMYTEKEQE